MIKIITKEQVVGVVTRTDKDGNETEEYEVVDEVVVDKPMANVGVKLGRTTNTGDYESLRVDVSLYMPSDTDKKSLDKTFKKCLKWCDKKMDGILN
jgi:hypothetical protein